MNKYIAARLSEYLKRKVEPYEFEDSDNYICEAFLKFLQEAPDTFTRLERVHDSLREIFWYGKEN